MQETTTLRTFEVSRSLRTALSSSSISEPNQTASDLAAVLKSLTVASDVALSVALESPLLSEANTPAKLSYVSPPYMLF